MGGGVGREGGVEADRGVAGERASKVNKHPFLEREKK